MNGLPSPRSRAVALVALGVFACEMALADRYGVFRDELYYVACGRHLAWGYVDHPPLVAVMARISCALFGESLRGLRLWPAACAAATVLLAGELTRALGGGRFAQLLAAVCVALCPELLGIDHVLSMNCVLPVAWTGGILLATHALVRRRPRAWIGFGLACGIGLLAKHSTLLFGAAFAVGLLATAHRRALATRWPWIGLALAGLLFAPNVAWEIAHRWPTLEFMHAAQELKMVRLGPAAFSKELVLAQDPIALPVWLGGLAWLTIARAARPFRFLAVTYVALVAIVIAGGGKPYYVSGIFPLGFAAGGVAIEGWIERRAARFAVVCALAVSGLLVAPMSLPVLGPEAYRAYAARLGVAPVADEKHAMGPLPQFFADQFGWEALAERTARAYRALSPPDRRVAAIYATNYGEAGAIDFYGPRLGLPTAASGHNSYHDWGPPPGRGQVLIAIGEMPDGLARAYGDCRLVDETDEPYAMPYENHLPIHVCRAPEQTLRALWPRTKHYI